MWGGKRKEAYRIPLPCPNSAILPVWTETCFSPDGRGFIHGADQKLQYFSLPGGMKAAETSVTPSIVDTEVGAQGMECSLVGMADFGRMRIYSVPEEPLIGVQDSRRHRWRFTICAAGPSWDESPKR